MKNGRNFKILLILGFLALPLQSKAESNLEQFTKLKTSGATIKVVQINDSQRGPLIRETRSLLLALGEIRCERTIEAQSKKELLLICEEISDPSYIDNIQNR
jgi:hypothetical protein